MAKVDFDGVPPSVLTYSARLSDRAQRTFQHCAWSVDEALRCSHAEFQSRLEEQGYPEWPFLWPIEEAFGGVEGLRSVEIGIADMLTDHAAKDEFDRAVDALLLPMGYQGQFYLYIGTDGGIYSELSGRMEKKHLSFDSFLEEEAMNLSLDDWWHDARRLQVGVRQRNVGRRLAEQWAVPPVAEASNELYGWWQDEEITINDDGYAHATVVQTKSLSRLIAAILTMAESTPSLEVHPHAALGSNGDLEHRHTSRAELLERAPTREILRARPLVRMLPLGDSAYGREQGDYLEGEVWITGIDRDLRIDVLERSFGKLTAWWTIGQTDSCHLSAAPAGP